MDGISFKPDIWIAKKRVLEQTGLAVTRRLDGLKLVNQEPEWMVFCKPISGWQSKSLPCVKSEIIRPRYRTGQVVFVREVFATEKAWDSKPMSFFDKASDVPIWYRINDPLVADFVPCGKWRSPLFMPAWAARSFLQVVSVRPELYSYNAMTWEELQLEGGEPAASFLKEYDRKWLFRYEIKLVERPEGLK